MVQRLVPTDWIGNEKRNFFQKKIIPHFSYLKGFAPEVKNVVDLLAMAGSSMPWASRLLFLINAAFRQKTTTGLTVEADKSRKQLLQTASHMTFRIVSKE